ncbi:hypothetical protein OSB04_006494 [Centaurea solstitialis]|uniref:Leucine-rich repeat-containing N-terminal plant-type domain-containing protein n=1 Tax=Centaurea solstitialis TaxID=347529 RepID=A0AA38WS18_9ASTR|nr:hypothetical protein OSB04_006494 [Centaurea solstitialis]
MKATNCGKIKQAKVANSMLKHDPVAVRKENYYKNLGSCSSTQISPQIDNQTDVNSNLNLESLYSKFIFAGATTKSIKRFDPGQMIIGCRLIHMHTLSLALQMSIVGYSSVMVSGIEGGCIQEERNALLQIKTSLIDLYGLDVDRFLPSWVDDGRECCDWERVMCNTTTGHVTDLSLRNVMGILDYQYYDTSCRINLPLNVSLFLHFKELTSLNLSMNCLDDGIVNTGLGRLSSLKKLEILDLSDNRITNKTLPSLGALTSLRVLNLNDNNLEGYFPALGMCLLKS